MRDCRRELNHGNRHRSARDKAEVDADRRHRQQGDHESVARGLVVDGLCALIPPSLELNPNRKQES